MLAQAVSLGATTKNPGWDAITLARVFHDVENLVAHSDEPPALSKKHDAWLPKRPITNGPSRQVC